MLRKIDSIQLNNPRAKSGIIVTTVISISIVLLVNLMGYESFARNPPAGTVNTVNDWIGIQTWRVPVDNILLGDSTVAINWGTGPVSDRLGGTTVNLADTTGTSFLMDAWMLSAYVQRFGAPHNVIIERTSPSAYRVPPNKEYLAFLPLGWGWWNRYGVTPAWDWHEELDVFLTKYAVLISEGDMFRERILHPSKFFTRTIQATLPSSYYNPGTLWEQDPMDIKLNLPGAYFSESFAPSNSTTKALQYMSDLARSKKFQLYIVFQPEWDEAIEAGLRTKVLKAQEDYLSQFVDADYVHFVHDPALTFNKEQMQSTQHLRAQAANVFTEAYVNGIISIQNQLTADKAQPLVTTVNVDKTSFRIGEKPVITLTVNNKSKTDVKGSVSYLIRPVGRHDGEWVVRAPAVSINIPVEGKLDIELFQSVGEVDKAGVYDLVVFVRQEVGTLSYENRIELLRKIVVN